MRNLSPEMLEEVFAQYNPSTLVMLLRFVGVDNSGTTHTLRYVNDWQPIVSNGETFQPSAFRATLAADNPENMPSVNLTTSSGDSQVVEKLRVFNKAPRVYLSMVVAERPNIVEFPETEFEVTSWVANAGGVNIVLDAEPVLNEPVPADIISPTIHPLLWENVLIEGVDYDDGVRDDDDIPNPNPIIPNPVNPDPNDPPDPIIQP